MTTAFSFAVAAIVVAVMTVLWFLGRVANCLLRLVANLVFRS
jgi:hypothetical protein